MDHTDIDEHGTAESYVTGRLPAEERAAFERHLVDCPECLDRVDSAEAFRRSLSALSAADVATSAPRNVPRARWTPALRRSSALALAAGLLLALGIPLGLTLRAARESVGELRVQQGRTAALQGQVARVEQELQAERDRRAHLEAALAQDRKPQVALPVLALAVTRGGGAEILRLPRTPQWIVLSLEREDPLRFQTYRATLFTAAGVRLWQGEATPTSRDVLAIGFHSSLFAPGSYALELDGVGRGGRFQHVVRFPFRVTQADG